MRANTFVFGCPRSGTTLLAELLNCNPNCTILVERHSRLSARKTLTLADYERPSVSNFAENPCEHINLNRAILENQLLDSETKLFGDKIPKLYENQAFFDSIVEPTDVTMLATLRNVFDVCLSYDARLKSQSDAWSHTISDGVRDWNAYILRTRSIAKKFRVIQFDYDDASRSFDKEDDFFLMAQAIYLKLGISTQLPDSSITALRNVFTIAKGSLPSASLDRASRRLAPIEMKEIISTADFTGYKELLANSSQLINA